MAGQRKQPRGTVREIFFPINSIPFWGVHITAVVGVAILGFSWSGLALTAAVYFTGIFFVTAVYHRYFSHRSYKTSRPMQLLLAIGATLTVQKGVLWWASHHRQHHRDSDGPDDVHSPVQDGFWYSQFGWILSKDYQTTDYSRIKDFARFPELRWLNRFHLVPPITYAVILYFVGGFHALTWGFMVSTVLLWHGTFTINSLAHVIGRARYQTGDDSRNHWLLAIITLGEGWHNNHHHYQLSCRQGFRWYEIDITYYILRLMAALRLVWDIRVAPPHVVAHPGRAQRSAGGGEAKLATALGDEAMAEAAQAEDGHRGVAPGSPAVADLVATKAVARSGAEAA